VTSELIELGYEEDDAWLATLDGIEPDMNPSHWPEVLDRTPAQRVRHLRTSAGNYARLAVGALERLAGRTVG
jgi:hypothetical protein